ncbi:MAG: ABC transporter ATP-binding protein [Deltaproteobacteria bacterium]|nr:ABC transporter ATP-binding protein [Deltaproteobacteria bacterium]
MNGEVKKPEAFRVEGLRKSFFIEGKRLDVLKGVDIEFRPGEMLCIVGASGAGKSTFLHVLGTLDSPTSGRVLYGDTDVTALDPARLARFRNRTIGFVFQFHHLLPDFTALENCSLPARIAGLPEAQAEAMAAEVLAKVGLSERLAHKPGELSGGEQQRVAVARALVMRPALLLADEPTGNLDTATGESVHELLLSLNRMFDMTVIVVTHNERLAARMPRVLTMADGVLAERPR